MKFKYRIMIGFSILILIFTGVIVNNLVFLNRTSDRIKLIVEKKFTVENSIQNSYQIILSIHADIWDTMLFNQEKRQSAIEHLNNQAKEFYKNIDDLMSKIPEEEDSLKQLTIVFRAYYLFGSTILEMKDLQEFHSKIDTVNKFKENKISLTMLLDKTVGASKKAFEQSLVELNKSFMDTGFYTAVLTAVVILLAVLISLVIAGWLTKPVENLTAVAQRVAGGDYQIRAALKAHGEILVLSNTFNNMLQTIEQYSENMEDLVRKRTEELRQTNAQLTIAYDFMKKELNMARTIQQALIPTKFPNYDTLSIDGKYLPMEELGGDFYDVFNIEAKKVGIVIADVSGHGVPAALVTAMAKISFGTNSLPGRSAGEIVGHVNKELCTAIKDIMQYLTVFYCIIDMEKSELQYCNAGHDEIIIIRDNKDIIELPPNSPVVGYKNYNVYNTSVIKICEGDKICLYTDGIPEARNNDSQLFGMERFKDTLLKNSKASAQEMIRTVFKEVNGYIGEAPARDDITLLIAEILFALEGLKIDLEILNASMSASSSEPDSGNKEHMDKYIKALNLYKNGDYNKISALVEGLDSYLKQKEDKINLYNLLAFTFIKMNDMQNARKYWKKILGLDPGNKRALDNISSLKK